MNSIDLGHFRRRRGNDLDPAAIYRAAATCADVGITVQDMSGIILWTNNAYGDMMGYHPYELVGKNPLSYALPPEDMPSEEEIANFKFEKPKDGAPWVEVARNIRSDGSTFWIEMQVSFAKLRGFGEVAILVTRDISEHVERRMQVERNAEELRRLALTDSLTGLANRYALMQSVYDIWDEKSPNVLPTSIMYVDVDRLRLINDGAGQSAGDHVLKEIAKRMKQSMGPFDLVARTGGDEFIILCRSAETEVDLVEVATLLQAVAARPITFKDTKLHTSLTVGAAIAPPEGLGPETLLKRANFALKSAKDLGHGQAAIYDFALHTHRMEQDTLAEELRHAIKNNQLSFYFQPTLDLALGQVRGMETLVRWNNPRLGLLSPDKFLPLARNIGVMADIDMAALYAALQMLRQLREAGHESIRIGLNGSAEFLSISDFSELFFAALDNYGVAPSSIVFEVLETVVFEDISQSNPLVREVQTLHDKGVTVLLDDFGTGHAGLTHLAKLAIDGIKIDRSLTENILTDQTSAKIVGMMHDLCNDLGIYVVTEGIETTEQARCLAGLGGKIIQGYWLSKPMPAKDVLPWLNNQRDWIKEMHCSAIAAAP